MKLVDMDVDPAGVLEAQSASTLFSPADQKIIRSDEIV